MMDFEATADASSGQEFGRHWRTLLGCTLAAAVGTIGLQAYTSGAFAGALVRDGAYTRTQLSLGTLILSVGVALMAPLAGAAMDRWGAVRVVTLSLFGEAAAFALLGAHPVGFPAFAGAMALLALLGVGTTPPGFARIVTSRFDRTRGLALGVMISGLGIMAITAPIWTTALIGVVGWRGGYLTLAAIVLAIGGTGVLLIRSDGEHVPTRLSAVSGGGDWSALRTSAFWMMVAGFSGAALFGGGYLLHLIPVLEDRGFTPAGAARVQSLIGVAVLTGRLASGAALDRFDPRHVAGVAFTISAVGCLLLLGGSPLVVSVAALAIGLTIGAELDIMAYMISRSFGLASFGRLYGLAYGLMISAGGFSPVLIALLSEHRGYSLALLASAAGLTISALVLVAGASAAKTSVQTAA